jgi:hypothetical protein
MVIGQKISPTQLTLQVVTRPGSGMAIGQKISPTQLTLQVVTRPGSGMAIGQKISPATAHPLYLNQPLLRYWVFVLTNVKLNSQKIEHKSFNY